MFELVIRNGIVVDGTGFPSFHADVGIASGKIMAIGRIQSRGAQEIDAEGNVVTPGFIDGHTHMDAQIFWDPLGSSSCWHGVTTAVMGHCGFTLAPAAYDQRDLVLANLERAEDISPTAMAAGIDWTWTTFAEYLDAVDRQPKGINYAANVGHSALRTFAMGERAFTEKATEVDLATMVAELGAALDAGAFGFSTSRSGNHKRPDNGPVASRLAPWDEVRRLVEAMGERGGGIFQLVEDDAPDRIEQQQRLIDLAEQTGVVIAIPAVNSRALGVIDAAQAAGVRMFGLTHSRGIATLSSFKSHLPFDILTEWRDVRQLPLDELRCALGNPDVRQRLIWSAHNGDYGSARRPDFEQMVVLLRPVPPNATVAEVAAERRIDPVEAIIDLSLEADLCQFFVQPVTPSDPEFIKAAMKHPNAVMTFSDAGAHVSRICDCSIQTHLLAYWVRDRQEFTLEEAVRMLTLAPARAWGFSDRGLLRVGMVADINVFDPSRVAPLMPTLVHDLPAGEPRLTQRSEGFLATVVSGEVVLRNGEHTGALPGRLIRRTP